MTTLDLQADLTLLAGDVPARITGDGQRLTLVTDDVARLWDEVARTARPAGGPPLSRLLGQAAAALDAAGATFAVAGASGTVLEIGRGCDSRLALTVTGDRHVRLGSARVVRATALRVARTSAARHRAPLAVAGAAVLGTVLGAISLGTLFRRRRP